MVFIVKHKIMHVMYVFALFTLFLPNSSCAGEESVFIDELTTAEIRKKIDSGTDIAIIPTGGSEQNGIHMAIGKHNVIVHYTAKEIAKNLGNALVAPVITYVPEGTIEPPEGHMLFAGTISVREETFEALLEDAASSLKQHGFKLICFLGDSGGNQKAQRIVADRLTQKWKKEGIHVFQVSDYYDNNGQDEWVKSQKLAIDHPEDHAAFEDTSELMAIDESYVRKNLLGKHSNDKSKINGISGDSTLASAEYGKYLLNLKIKSAVNQIRNAK